MKLRDEETQILYEFTISDQGEYVVEPIDEDQSNWQQQQTRINELEKMCNGRDEIIEELQEELKERYIKTARIVVEDRSKWHPHHDLIVAWARGAEIQYLNPASNEWLDIMFNSPSWKVSIKYRIKPDNSEKIAKAEKNFRWLENEVNDLKRKLAKLRG